MGTLGSSMKDVKERSRAVAAAAGHLETLLVQVEALDEQLVLVRSPETLESVQEEFAVLDRQFREELDVAASRGLDAEHLLRLQTLYREFRERHDALVSLCASNAADEEVAAYLTKEIRPRIDQMRQIGDAVMDESARMLDQLHDDAAAARDLTVAVSSAFVALAVGTLALVAAVLVRRSRRQRQREEGLHCALQEARQASEAKSRFLSDVSHDIRTPLTVIIGLTDIAAAHAAERARVVESLEKIKCSSHHLLNLVNDVLFMSKIECGQTDVDHAPFDLRALMKDLVALMVPQAVAKGLEFEAFRCDVGEGMVVGDEARVRQVLVNLLGNAVKHTEPGGHVRLGAFLVDDPARAGCAVDAEPVLTAGGATASSTAPAAPGGTIRVVRFVVQDDAIGMAEDYPLRALEPSASKDVPARFAVDRTGLGLSLAMKLVDLMGGTIMAESARGKGTAFTVDLPFPVCDVDRASAREGRASTAAPTRPGALDSACASASWDHVRVLLAEDNDLMGEISEEFIAATGASVDRAWDGVEALDLFERAPEGFYDLVFLDVQMPRLDGLAAARAIVAACERTGRPHPPLVAMTANAYAEDRARAQAAGMDDYLVKPIDVNEIVRTFQRHVKPPVGVACDEASGAPTDRAPSAPTDGVRRAAGDETE